MCSKRAQSVPAVFSKDTYFFAYDKRYTLNNSTWMQNKSPNKIVSCCI